MGRALLGLVGATGHGVALALPVFETADQASMTTTSACPCLHIVRRDYGAQVADAVARGMVVPPHRDGGQAQFIERPVPLVAEADALGPALVWAMKHLDWPQSVPDLARRAAMSPRTFARRGFGSAAALRMHFRRAFDTSPQSYRGQFGPGLNALIAGAKYSQRTPAPIRIAR